MSEKRRTQVDRTTVGVSIDEQHQWPVFRLSHMRDTDPETVEAYRRRIEAALNDFTHDDVGLLRAAHGNNPLHDTDLEGLADRLEVVLPPREDQP